MLNLQHLLYEHDALVFSTLLIVQLLKSLFLCLFEPFLRDDPEFRCYGFVQSVLKDFSSDIRNLPKDGNG